MSPLSYTSILISPASVSICFTNGFARFVSTAGLAGSAGGAGFTTGVVYAGKSGCGYATWVTSGCLLTAAGVVFFNASFGAAGLRFAVTRIFGAAVTTGGGGTHSRKVMSSNAKSFPQP